MYVLIDENGYKLEDANIKFAINYIDAQTLHGLIEKGADIVLGIDCIPLIISESEIIKLTERKKLHSMIGRKTNIMISNSNNKINIRNATIQRGYRSNTYLQINEILRQSIIGIGKAAQQGYIVGISNDEFKIISKYSNGVSKQLKMYNEFVEVRSDAYVENIIKQCNNMGIFIKEIVGNSLITDCKDIMNKISDY